MIKYKHITHSTTRYFIPSIKTEKEYYVFRYNELRLLFYVLVLKLPDSILSEYVRVPNTKNIINLINKKYDSEVGIYYIPKSHLKIIQDRFIKEYKQYIANNTGLKNYFKKKFEVLNDEMD